jgi:hypothetical protein
MKPLTLEDVDRVNDLLRRALGAIALVRHVIEHPDEDLEPDQDMMTELAELLADVAEKIRAVKALVNAETSEVAR